MNNINNHKKSDDIYFFREYNENGYMSNFYPTNFTDDGIPFNCSEQWFMYQKCLTFDPNNNRLRCLILTELNPKMVKKYGRQVKNFDEDIWNSKKYDIMVDALRLKFNQNLEIKKKLLSTKGKKLYEASPYDKIWGIGVNYQTANHINKNSYGQNLLGKALIQVRDELDN